MSNYAIDTAARFGEIPFVEFTKELVTGVFDSLVEAHILQMEEYSDFISALSRDLSTYINETKDDIPFSEIVGFINGLNLPENNIDNATLTSILNNLNNPSDSNKPDVIDSGSPSITDNATWWSSLISNLAPAVTGLVDKIRDPNLNTIIDSISEGNSELIKTTGLVIDKIPTYKQIHDAVAMMITSNKYGLLQAMAQQGALRLVVTEGEIETKITFSTWNNSTSGSSTDDKVKDRTKTKDKRGIFGRILKGKDKTKTRTVTVNTAKSYQRDSSGTRVDIFGRVLIKFKTDYAPLNG